MKKASFTTCPFQVQNLVLNYIQVTPGTLAEILSALCGIISWLLVPFSTLNEESDLLPFTVKETRSWISSPSAPTPRTEWREWSKEEGGRVGRGEWNTVGLGKGYSLLWFLSRFWALRHQILFSLPEICLNWTCPYLARSKRPIVSDTKCQGCKYPYIFLFLKNFRRGGGSCVGRPPVGFRTCQPALSNTAWIDLIFRQIDMLIISKWACSLVD